MSSASAAYPEDVSVEASDDELIDANDLDGGTERFQVHFFQMFSDIAL